MSESSTQNFGSAFSGEETPQQVPQQPVTPPFQQVTVTSGSGFQSPIQRTQGGFTGQPTQSRQYVMPVGGGIGTVLRNVASPMVKIFTDAIREKARDMPGYDIHVMQIPSSSAEMSTVTVAMVQPNGGSVSYCNLVIPNPMSVTDKVKYPQTTVTYSRRGLEVQKPPQIVNDYLVKVEPVIRSQVQAKFPNLMVIPAGAIGYFGDHKDIQAIDAHILLVLNACNDVPYLGAVTEQGLVQVISVINEATGKPATAVITCPTVEQTIGNNGRPVSSDMQVCVTVEHFDPNDIRSVVEGKLEQSAMQPIQSTGVADVYIDVMTTGEPCRDPNTMNQYPGMMNGFQDVKNHLIPVYVVSCARPPYNMMTETGILLMLSSILGAVDNDTQFENIVAQLAGRSPGWAGGDRIHPHVGALGFHGPEQLKNISLPGNVYDEVHSSVNNNASGTIGARALVHEFVIRGRFQVCMDLSPLDAGSHYTNTLRMCGYAATYINSEYDRYVTFMNQLAASLTGSQLFASYASATDLSQMPQANPVAGVYPVLIGKYTRNGREYPLTNLLNYFTIAEHSRAVDNKNEHPMMMYLDPFLNNMTFDEHALVHKQLLQEWFGDLNPKIEQVGARLMLNTKWWQDLALAIPQKSPLSLNIVRSGFEQTTQLRMPSGFIAGASSTTRFNPGMVGGRIGGFSMGDKTRPRF